MSTELYENGQNFERSKIISDHIRAFLVQTKQCSMYTNTQREVLLNNVKVLHLQTV